MMRYELKKVFGTFGSKVALVVLAFVVVLNCWTATHGHGTDWVNEQGHEESGPAAIAKLREARKAWAGPLDTEWLTAAMTENARINATPEAQSRDLVQNDIAYGWKQGISDIREVVNQFLAEDFSSYSYYRADSVPLSALPELYENRVRLLKEYLYDPSEGAFRRYSDTEKAWMVAQYAALEAPMEYDYHLGWKLLITHSDMITMVCAMILGYLVAGIFANEYKWQADAVYFSTLRGRTSAAWAKIQAAFVLVTALYWGSMGIYSLYTLGYLGFDGGGCPVQLDRWKCFYNLTFARQYLLVLLGGYLGNLFSAFLAMWISARTKTSLLAVTMPFLLIFLPNFFQNYEGSFFGKLLGLMPDRLLQVGNAMNYFDVYSIGSFVTGAIPVLFGLYLLLTGALVPLMHRTFVLRRARKAGG